MKSIKIIGIAVATLGVAASIGGAIALYTKAASPVGFGIGAATYTSSTDSVTYKIDGKTSGTVNPAYQNGSALNGLTSKVGDNEPSSSVTYTFPLTAEYAEGLTAQTYVMGKVAVSLTNVDTKLYGKMQVACYFSGYTADTYGKSMFEANFADSDNPGNDLAITSTKTSMSVDKDVCVAATGGQSLVVWIGLTGVDAYDMDEASSLWNLSVTWGGNHGWTLANMANTSTSFGEDDEFVMAPNIGYPNDNGNPVLQWMGAIKGTDTVTAAKCRKGDKWENHDDHSLTKGKTYDVYWLDDGTHEANFSERP